MSLPTMTLYCRPAILGIARSSIRNGGSWARRPQRIAYPRQSPIGNSTSRLPPLSAPNRPHPTRQKGGELPKGSVVVTWCEHDDALRRVAHLTFGPNARTQGF